MEPSSEEFQELTQSIAANGLLEPISVRKTPSGYQIIFGHRRVLAYGRLHFNAVSPQEKERYRAIPARVVPDVTDAQMLLWALTENVQRSSLSPLETAQALAQIQSFYPEVKSAKELSKLTGLSTPKIHRLLRLAKAPAVVQSAVSGGILVPAEDPDDDRPENERPTEHCRTLDLNGALEFSRLHAYFLKKYQGKKDGRMEADAKTGEAIEKALKSDRGFRQIQHFVDKTMAGENRKAASRGRPKEPFKSSRNQLVIYRARIADLSSAQKSALKELLEPLWKLVSDAS